MSDRKVDPLDETRAEAGAPGTLIAGAPIGGYSLKQILGEGGMGVVWSAHDPLLDRTIAIKVLKRGDAPPALRLRLLREARAMARLKHPNVLTVYEVGTEGDRDFIAMELVDGGPLDEWLQRDPPRGDVIAALLAAGRGLAAAHAAGLVHRDFKPNNVLRSRDGRVLVTDFGLARGLAADDEPSAGDAPAVSLDAAVASGHRADSVLHSPLTKTGAMIGTPAYMAPEQYAGAAPDPRTDQFAFCVTAWQALTGARPYHGRTLDELRLAVGAGVDHVVTDLPKPLRAVLVRGLDPDPANRWPDLEALLAAVAEAATPRRRIAPLVVAAGVGVPAIAVIAIVVATRGGGTEAPPVCESGAAVMSDADAKLPAVPAIAMAFAEHRARWLAEYEATCKEPKPVQARIDCLRAIRDRTSVIAELTRRVDGPTLAHFDAAIWLPHPATCAVRTVVPPAIPEAERGRVIGVLAKLLALRDSADVSKTAVVIETEARGVAWPPLIGIVHTIAGAEYVRRGDGGRARAVLTAAIGSAGDDARLVALARLALLEASLGELTEPGADGKPEQPHPEHARALTYARAAVRSAGDEPVLAGMLALADARVTADVSHRGKKHDFAEPLARVVAARRHFEAAGDRRRQVEATVLELELQLAQATVAGTGARMLESAGFAARSAAKLLEDAKLPRSPELDRLRARVAFARSNIEEAHELHDRDSGVTAPVDPPVRGKVVDAEGHPTSATVVAWTGELHGDHVRLYTDPGTLHGDVVESAADGTFSIRAPATAAVIAQRGDQRSAPQLLGDGTQPIKLAPTTEVMGKVSLDPAAAGEQRSPLVDAFARFTAGKHVWLLHAPVEDAAFRIRRLPRGTPAFGTIGDAGEGTRRITAAAATKLAWPAGKVHDIIARGALTDGATVWIGVTPALSGSKTRAEVEAAAAAAPDVIVAPLVPIGSHTTDAGRALYGTGDRHAIIVGTFARATACIAATPEPTAPVACAALGEPAVRIVIESAK